MSFLSRYWPAGPSQAPSKKKVKKQPNLGTASPAPTPTDQQQHLDSVDMDFDRLAASISFDGVGDVLAEDSAMLQTLDDMFV